VFEDIENLRVAGEVVEQLEALAKERNVDLKKFLKKDIKLSELLELAKLIPELQTRQKPGLKPTGDVLLAVAHKASKDGISPTEASKRLYKNHQRWLRAKADEPRRWEKLVLKYKLKSKLRTQ
jgi:Zn-dependent M16 (insulinase) family peptidase